MTASGKMPAEKSAGAKGAAMASGSPSKSSAHLMVAALGAAKKGNEKKSALAQSLVPAAGKKDDKKVASSQPAADIILRNLSPPNQEIIKKIAKAVEEHPRLKSALSKLAHKTNEVDFTISVVNHLTKEVGQIGALKGNVHVFYQKELSTAQQCFIDILNRESNLSEKQEGNSSEFKHTYCKLNSHHFKKGKLKKSENFAKVKEALEFGSKTITFERSDATTKLAQSPGPNTPSTAALSLESSLSNSDADSSPPVDSKKSGHGSPVSARRLIAEVTVAGSPDSASPLRLTAGDESPVLSGAHTPAPDPQPLSLASAVKEEALPFKDAVVFMGICVGYDGRLESDLFQMIIERLLAGGAKEIIVFLPDYDRFNAPVSKLADFGNDEIKKWLKNNAKALENPKVIVTTESKLEECSYPFLLGDEAYKQSLEKVFTTLAKSEDLQKRLVDDAVTFLEHKLDAPLSPPELRSLASPLRAHSPSPCPAVNSKSVSIDAKHATVSPAYESQAAIGTMHFLELTDAVRECFPPIDVGTAEAKAKSIPSDAEIRVLASEIETFLEKYPTVLINVRQMIRECVASIQPEFKQDQVEDVLKERNKKKFALLQSIANGPSGRSAVEIESKARASEHPACTFSRGRRLQAQADGLRVVITGAQASSEQTRGAAIPVVAPHSPHM
jgi:hypothetical protein